MTFRVFLTGAALSLIAFSAQAAEDQVRCDPAAETQAVAQTKPASSADVDAVPASIDRAERDTTLRTRGAAAVTGQAAGGLGNVTDGVEVAGEVKVSADKGSISGSGSVATGNN